MLNFLLAKTKEKRKKKATIAQTKLKMFGFNGRTYWEKLTSKSSLLVMVQLKILVTVQHRKIF